MCYQLPKVVLLQLLYRITSQLYDNIRGFNDNKMQAYNFLVRM